MDNNAMVEALEKAHELKSRLRGCNALCLTSDVDAIIAATVPAQSEASEGRDAWQPIETAPKDGTEIIVSHPVAGVCAAFCPGAGFAWHCMDGQNTVIGSKSKTSIPSMTSFIKPPTHWMPLPAAPIALKSTKGESE